MAIQSLNPFTGELLKNFEEYSSEKINHILLNADEAFLAWKNTSFKERAILMNSCSDILEQHKHEYANLMALEMGKVLREGLAEIEKCALACRYYAEHSAAFLANKPLEVPDGKAYIQSQPIGAVLAIMPWNFPFWQVFRFAAPTIMAGNVALLKHASNVPQCALAIENVFKQAGFPDGVFQTMLISASSTESIIASPTVAAVTLTGSEEAGKKVGATAGKHLKKTVLELGGSDVFIVLADADLDLVIEMAVKSRMVNCGQSCIAAKRFIIHERLYKPFIDTFSSKLSQLKIGDPLDSKTDYGPMASVELAEELELQVSGSIALGALPMLPLKRVGALFQPCILTNLKPDMPAYSQELFGPVASVWSFRDDDEAVRLANNSVYGLGGSVWGATAHAEFVASKIDSGAVYVNKMMASHPAVPFGGIKHSGYGRELSYVGILEFVNQKTIWLS